MYFNAIYQTDHIKFMNKAQILCEEIILNNTLYHVIYKTKQLDVTELNLKYMVTKIVKDTMLHIFNFHFSNI